MELFSLEGFLDLFKSSPTDKYTLDDFISNYKVVVGNKQHN